MLRRHLPRRALLKGLGASIALPFLDAMTPAFGATARIGGPQIAKAPFRMAFTYVPNGIMMDSWTPGKFGTDFEMSRIMAPLAPFKKNMLVLSGLSHHNGEALGDGAGDHARAAASFLTGMHPRKTDGADIAAGVSIDQIVAQKGPNQTRFGSIELACEDGRLVGNCDSGYSCAYSNGISWRTPSQPNPPEVNPRAVFERLFGESDEDPSRMALRAQYRKSILDFVADDASALKGSLGPTDNRKLDEYLDGIRSIERRIEQAEKDGRVIVPSMEHPDGVPVEYTEHLKLMFDLLAVAFQTDSTRVGTFMMAREGSTRSYREIGISDAHHPLTHHRNEEELMEKVRKINCFHMQQYAYFLEKLRSIPEGDGTLLDNVMVVYGSGLSDGNKHEHNNLPVLVAGGGAGTLKSGRHIQYKKDTPMANLFVSMLDRAGVKRELLGDATGELPQLTDLT
jgi:hypothetical protein